LSELVDVLRQRADQLEVPRLEIDRIAGTPAGYVGKVLSAASGNGLGMRAMDQLTPALGLRMIAIEDQEAFEGFASRMERRKLRRKKLCDANVSMLGRKMRFHGVKKLSPERRSEIARLRLVLVGRRRSRDDQAFFRVGFFLNFRRRTYGHRRGPRFRLWDVGQSDLDETADRLRARWFVIPASCRCVDSLQENRGKPIAVTGSRPVAGLPLAFGTTLLILFTSSYASVASSA
jgi:hypothetical protein